MGNKPELNSHFRLAIHESIVANSSYAEDSSEKRFIAGTIPMSQQLTAKERKVLAVAYLDRRSSAPVLARRAGVQTHTVVYTLKKLIDRQLVRPFTLMNLHVFGLTDYCVFFNVISDAKRVRSQVLDYCVCSTQTTYVAELTGKYQFSVSIFARSIVEVELFFDGLMQKIPRSSIEMSFAIRSQWSVLPLKYLDPIASKMAPVTRLASQREVEIDATDRRILIELSKDADISWTRLGAKVGLGVSGVHYRIESLFKRGVILSFAYCLDGSKIGRSPFRILIVARGMQSKLQGELFRFASQHALCTMFVRCLGAWDFELNFDLEYQSQGGEIVQEVYDQFGPSIQSSMTVTELGIWKVHEFPTRDAFETE